jgi:hypothetical protein
MWKDWVWPVLGLLLKFAAAVGLLVGVWMASALYHERSFRESADNEIQIRVRRDCLRPDWVQTMANAEEYDVTERELGVISDSVDLLRRRTSALLNESERVEALRLELAQGKVKVRGGVGGPAPTKR